MITQLQELYTTAEVAAAKKVSVWYIRDLVKTGKVTPRRTSAAKNAPMRFGPEQLEQIDQAMTPQAPLVDRPKRIRLPRAARRGT